MPGDVEVDIGILLRNADEGVRLHLVYSRVRGAPLGRNLHRGCRDSRPLVCSLRPTPVDCELILHDLVVKDANFLMTGEVLDCQCIGLTGIN